MSILEKKILVIYKRIKFGLNLKVTKLLNFNLRTKLNKNNKYMD